MRAAVIILALWLGMDAAMAADAAPKAVFLQGDRLEVGLAPAGTIGAMEAAPAGYVKAGSGLGLVFRRSDLPGGASQDIVSGRDPVERWSLKWRDDAGTEVLKTNAGTVSSGTTPFSPQVDIPAESFTTTSSGTIRSALWTGTATAGGDRIRVLQTLSFDAASTILHGNVVLTNTGSSIIHDLRYLRLMDTDQDGEDAKGAITANTIVFQPPVTGLAAIPGDNSDRALVMATGQVTKIAVSIGALDSRANVAHLDASAAANKDPDAVIASAIAGPVDSVADEAIALGYRLGDIAPGNSVVISFAYFIDLADPDAAIAELRRLEFLAPTRDEAGASARARLRTADPDQVDRVELRVDGTLVGSSDAPGTGGVFEIPFDARAFVNGTHRLTATAVYLDGSTLSRSSAAVFANAAPGLAFVAPTPAEGSAVSGPTLTIRVSLDDSSASLGFFRGETALSADAGDPLQASIPLEGLAPGTPVQFSVEARRADRTTVITRSITTPFPTSGAPVALAPPAMALSGAGVTRYAAICPGTAEGLDRLRSALAGRPRTQCRAFTWDPVSDVFVEYPAEPAGGIAPTHAWFVASRSALGLDFSGTSTLQPWTLTLQPGWNFVGVPPGDVGGATRTRYGFANFTLLDAQGAEVTGTARTAAIRDGAFAWNGAAYDKLTTLESGRGYWIANGTSGALTLRADATMPLEFAVLAAVATDADQPPPPPAAATAEGGTGGGGCGGGSSLAVLAMLLALGLGGGRIPRQPIAARRRRRSAVGRAIPGMNGR